MKAGTVRYAFLNFVLISLRLYTLQLGFVSLFGSCLCPSLSFEWMVCRCLLAPLSLQPFMLYRQLSVCSATLCSTVTTWHARHSCAGHLLQYRRVAGAASSGSVSSPLLPCSAFSSQVTVDPTRNVTGDDMPLAEAITQLSFLEFLQRSGVSIAPPQPSQPPVSISLQDATVQTTPPCDVSHQMSTQTSVQQDTLCV